MRYFTRGYGGISGTAVALVCQEIVNSFRRVQLGPSVNIDEWQFNRK